MTNQQSGDDQSEHAQDKDATQETDPVRLAKEPADRLRELAQALKQGDPVSSVSVRTFLGWFWGTQRRGRWIVSKIKKLLAEAGLETSPDFESAYIDAEISLLLATEAPTSQNPPSGSTNGRTAVVDDAAKTPAEYADPTYRISKLAAANRVPQSVKPDASVAEAVTIMLANDFSQLPVMTSAREVKGMVSWRSIGSRLSLGQTVTAVRGAMDLHVEVSADASLFGAIPLIIHHEYVLVRGFDKSIVGIITTSDLSEQFHQLTEPFLLLGEIENDIRRIIGTKFSVSQLVEMKEVLDDARSVESPADLTFGEYIRLLEEPIRWAELRLDLDRREFVKLLDNIRRIRNDVMHFDPDGITESDLRALRNFVRFLQTLQATGAI